MRLRVDLLPRGEYGDVVVLIDVLRSCTVAPILFDNGLKELYLCPSLRTSRKAAAEKGLLLLGERGGLVPEGFNYGNSPTELRQVNMAGRSAVMISENAPKTLPAVAGAKHVLLGSFYNADAVMARGLELATEEIALVCCGFGGEEDLDDVLVAGYLAGRLKQRLPEASPLGAGWMCLSLLKTFPDPLEALWYSRAGQALRRLELAGDLVVASLISRSDKAPRLSAVTEGERASLYRFEAVPTPHPAVPLAH